MLVRVAYSLILAIVMRYLSSSRKVGMVNAYMPASKSRSISMWGLRRSVCLTNNGGGARGRMLCYAGVDISKNEMKQWALSDWKEADGKTLVIVESPAKAKTIQKYLDEDKYIVDFSAGHIRDLPSKLEKSAPELKKSVILPEINLNVAHLGVDVQNDFEPVYVTLTKKVEVVKRLKKAMKSCSRLILATDEDREGEAISWHLVKLLDPKVPYKRAVFHEITKEAIFDSFQQPRDIDMDLVQSQETRRVLDRLAGYTVSPVLWRYVATGLSAGRVQSCGLNLIAQREKKRWSFKESEYFSIKGSFLSSLSDDSPRLADCRLLYLDDKRVADDRDFDGNTGGLSRGKDETNTIILEKRQAKSLMETLAREDAAFVVSDVESKKSTRSPPKPFITSTLQQAGSSKLRLSPSDTMRVAQELYEEGFITYMRTDSPYLSEAATNISRSIVEGTFGDKYVEKASSKSGATKGKGKTPKNAQEAHEAIRPAESGGSFRTPAQTNLEGRKRALYDLIYRRTLASVMSKAEYFTRTYLITSWLEQFDGCPFQEATFRTSERETIFAGFNAALASNFEYDDSSSSDSSTSIEITEGQTMWLADHFSSFSAFDDVPDFLDESEGADGDHDDTDNEIDQSSDDSEGDDGDEDPSIQIKSLMGVPRITKPPNRFSESSFIKELETVGVGRPSTYSKVIETLRSAERKYVIVDGHTLVPTITGLIVNEFLLRHFSDLTAAEFTARMEDSLDAIAHGKKDKLGFLSDYYLGGEAFDTDRDFLQEGADGLLHKVKSKLTNKEIDHTESRTLEFPPLEGIGYLRIGSSGAYFEMSNSSATAPSAAVAPVAAPSETTTTASDSAEDAQASRNRWKLPEAMQVDIRKISRDAIEEICATETTMAGATVGETEDGSPVTIRSGRFGKFLQVGRNDDKSKKYHSLPKWIDGSASLEQALEFSNLPHTVGDHPFLKDDQGTHRAMIVEVSSGAVSVGVKGYPLRIAIDDNIYPSHVSVEQAAELLSDTAAILDSQRILGTHKDEEVSIRKGRFGYYVRCGKLIAGLRKMEPDEVSLEIAIELIETRGKEIGSKSKSRGKVKAKAKPKTKSKAKAKATKAKAKKRVSAYIHFSKEYRETLKQSNPEASFAELSKLLSKRWAEMSDEEKSAYKEEDDLDGGVGGGSSAPKKTPSAYIQFCKSERPAVKLANPEASFGELSKLLSERWKTMTVEQKETYKVDKVPKKYSYQNK